MIECDHNGARLPSHLQVGERVCRLVAVRISLRVIPAIFLTVESLCCCVSSRPARMEQDNDRECWLPRLRADKRQVLKVTVGDGVICNRAAFACFSTRKVEFFC